MPRSWPACQKRTRGSSAQPSRLQVSRESVTAPGASSASRKRRREGLTRGGGTNTRQPMTVRPTLPEFEVAVGGDGLHVFIICRADHLRTAWSNGEGRRPSDQAQARRKNQRDRRKQQQQRAMNRLNNPLENAGFIVLEKAMRNTASESGPSPAFSSLEHAHSASAKIAHRGSPPYTTPKKNRRWQGLPRGNFIASCPLKVDQTRGWDVVLPATPLSFKIAFLRSSRRPCSRGLHDLPEAQSLSDLDKSE